MSTKVCTEGCGVILAADCWLNTLGKINKWYRLDIINECLVVGQTNTYTHTHALCVCVRCVCVCVCTHLCHV